MVTYCSAPNRVFSYMTGTGVPKGLCRLHAAGLNGQDRCERYDELMSIEEAEAEGIRQGYRIEFRSTESFWHLAAHFWQRRAQDPVPSSYDLLCQREELDPDEVYLGLVARSLV